LGSELTKRDRRFWHRRHARDEAALSTSACAARWNAERELAIVAATKNEGAMNLQLQEKIRDFRDRAQKSKLKATFTEEKVVKKMYEDAARQWENLADNLEKSGRAY
jgi:hypothetical protein